MAWTGSAASSPLYHPVRDGHGPTPYDTPSTLEGEGEFTTQSIDDWLVENVPWWAAAAGKVLIESVQPHNWGKLITGKDLETGQEIPYMADLGDIGEGFFDAWAFAFDAMEWVESGQLQALGVMNAPFTVNWDGYAHAFREVGDWIDSEPGGFLIAAAVVTSFVPAAGWRLLPSVIALTNAIHNVVKDDGVGGLLEEVAEITETERWQQGELWQPGVWEIVGDSVHELTPIVRDIGVIQRSRLPSDAAPFYLGDKLWTLWEWKRAKAAQKYHIWRYFNDRSATGNGNPEGGAVQ